LRLHLALGVYTYCQQNKKAIFGSLFGSLYYVVAAMQETIFGFLFGSLYYVVAAMQETIFGSLFGSLYYVVAAMQETIFGFLFGSLYSYARNNIRFSFWLFLAEQKEECKICDNQHTQ
jgi:hypothetical protein